MIDILLALVFVGIAGWFLYNVVIIIVGIIGGLFDDPTKRS